MEHAKTPLKQLRNAILNKISVVNAALATEQLSVSETKTLDVNVKERVSTK